MTLSLLTASLLFFFFKSLQVMHLVKRRRGGLRNTLGSWITRSHNQHSSYKQHGAVSQFRGRILPRKPWEPDMRRPYFSSSRDVFVVLLWHIWSSDAAFKDASWIETRDIEPAWELNEQKHISPGQKERQTLSFLWSQERRSRGCFFFLWWMCVWVIILEYSSANVPRSLGLVWANTRFLITK